ncbi:MAG: MurR/RpiR family transcriptional regulator [Pseudomonadota bacterium]
MSNPSPNGLFARLRASMAGWPPQMARVARYVLDQPDSVAHQTITDLAEASQTSEATITRLVRSAGFDGFARFRLAVALELAHLAQDQPAADPIRAPIDTMAEMAIAALKETASLQADDVIERAADMLAGARRVDVFAVGNSTPIAEHMSIKLLRAGGTVLRYDDAHVSVMAASTLTPDDVAVCVSSSGATLDVIRPAEHARKGGASVIAITNQARSKLSQLADITLVAANPEGPLTGGALPSKIGQMLIVDALLATLLERYPERLEAFERSAEAIIDRTA